MNREPSTQHAFNVTKYVVEAVRERERSTITINAVTAMAKSLSV